ncbi:pyridoxamine 5'-phosphate oxidase family protein [Sorangium sp. So ce315]|uniref:pyridoxamine 5'-phosphate oxidase family protein n=1 Tax=Sorangium sp. So ce315 TaxID=3133299 RepID=UPI003F5DA864
MSRLYGEQHRALQEQFNTSKLADRVEQIVVQSEVTDDNKAFIEARDMFFLSTVDHQGRPTVSYKGGAPGFVKVIDPKTVVFPSFDGNGMFFSMGNIAGNAQIGMLFIDFETPLRLRLQGVASVHTDDPLLAEYKEADLIVRVTVSDVWPNCPRYVHRYTKVAPSRYVPKDACETPLAGWKRIDLMQDVLPPKDHGRPEQSGGVITMGEWFEKIKLGEG